MEYIYTISPEPFWPGKMRLIDAARIGFDTDILGLVWSSVRRRIKKRFDVDIVATFHRDGDDIVVGFYPNACHAEVLEMELSNYLEESRRVIEDEILERFVKLLDQISEKLKYGFPPEEIVNELFPERVDRHKHRQQKQEKKEQKKLNKLAKEAQKATDKLAKEIEKI